MTGFPQDELINKTLEFLSPEVHFGSKQPDVLAEDFQFIFPVVGPLGKAEFCKVFGSFQVDKALPVGEGGASSNYFGFTIDPTEPNRVWFFARSKFIHTGKTRITAMFFVRISYYKFDFYILLNVFIYVVRFTSIRENKNRTDI